MPEGCLPASTVPTTFGGFCFRSTTKTLLSGTFFHFVAVRLGIHRIGDQREFARRMDRQIGRRAGDRVLQRDRGDDNRRLGLRDIDDRERIVPRLALNRLAILVPAHLLVVADDHCLRHRRASNKRPDERRQSCNPARPRQSRHIPSAWFRRGKRAGCQCCAETRDAASGSRQPGLDRDGRGVMLNRARAACLGPMEGIAMDVAFLTIAELNRLYDKRELSPVEVTKALLARIAAHDGKLAQLSARHRGGRARPRRGRPNAN